MSGFFLYLDFVLANHAFAVMALDHDILLVHDLETCRDRLVVGYALRIDALYYVVYLLWQTDCLLLHDLVVLNYVKHRVWSHKRNLVYLVRLEVFVRNLDYALYTGLLACQIIAYRYLLLGLVKTKYRHDFKKLVRRNVVYHCSVLQSHYYKFFLLF